MKSSPKNRLFICEIVPKRYIKETNVSQAGHNFCYNLIESGVFSNVLSLVPIFVSKHIEKNDKNITFVQSVVFPRRKFFRLLNTFWETFVAYTKASRYESVWFYNINAHTVLLFYMIKYLSKSRVNLILADHKPSNFPFSLPFLLGRSIKKAYAIISLSSRTEYSSHPRFSVIPGIVLPTSHAPCPTFGKPFFFFSGLLGEVTGISLALDVFSQIPEARLIISGRDDSGEIRARAALYPNIEYVGFLPVKEYMELLAKAGCCLNFRNPNLPENKNNFPSKLLEYMNFGKVVLSTMDYPELKGLPYIYTAYEQQKCITAVKSIISAWELSEKLSAPDPLEVQNLFAPAVWLKTINSIDSCN